ncbi:MAG TPA: DUF2950 family protein, partial [Candidatus Polarisedimenticolaceae bacterium]|nr:DUF2950 family protein [Candidatus Polarisedimenticolaceae bacterium]
PTVAPKTFATPEAAVDALLAAAEKWDVPALKEILGSDGVDLVVTEDPVQDKNQSAAFAAKAREKKRVSRSKSDPAKATLIIGSEDWPMPVPIVQKGGRWSFDTKAGRQEVLYRRIGRNELDAIEICRGYVEAQHERSRGGRQPRRIAEREQSGRQQQSRWIRQHRQPRHVLARRQLPVRRLRRRLRGIQRVERSVVQLARRVELRLPGRRRRTEEVAP